MKTVHVFDKPMCCSTGVCGPSVDPVLARFADDLRWLQSQGVLVSRHNPLQDAASFTRELAVLEAMKSGGEEVLPLVVIDGVERSRQRYPERGELASWAGIGSCPEPESSEEGDCCGDESCC